MIKHIKCDIFESGADIICHQVNCQGVMGSGIAKQVKERYPSVYAEYKQLCDAHSALGRTPLGTWQPVSIDTSNMNKYIINIFAQDHYGYDCQCYTDYDALKYCLNEIKETTCRRTIAFPYLMGCHRGGGDWNVVYKMIEEVFADSDCAVLICEYNGG
jgi:O-acetyl-ADP-ribose deacetylase (regulator of RNase III)